MIPRFFLVVKDSGSRRFPVDAARYLFQRYLGLLQNQERFLNERHVIARVACHDVRGVRH
jgi:hypothetical protein